MKIRVIVADGHPLVIAGIRHFLANVNTIDVVGTSRHSGEVVELLDQTACDILVSGYTMPGGKHGDGLAYFSFLRRRYPELKIIAFTAVDESSLLTKIARLGIRSVVSKASDMEQLLSAINAVFAGNTFFPEPAATSQACSPALSAKEAEVVRLFVSGLTTDEIAHKLCRSKKTISTQKCAARRKLGIGPYIELFRSFSNPGGLAAAF